MTARVKLFAKVRVHHGHGDYAIVAVRFSPGDGKGGAYYSPYWTVTGQRNRIASAVSAGHCDVLTFDELVRHEAERARATPYLDQLDTVPGYGAPYGATVDVDAGALSSPEWQAFARALGTRRHDTPDGVLAAVAAARGVALTIAWEYPAQRWNAEGASSHLDLPAEQRGWLRRWLDGPDVLEAEAEHLRQRAARARAAEEAAE